MTKSIDGEAERRWIEFKELASDIWNRCVRHDFEMKFEALFQNIENLIESLDNSEKLAKILNRIERLAARSKQTKFEIWLLQGGHKFIN